MRFTAFEEFVTFVGDEYGEPGYPQPEEQNGDYESGTVVLGSQEWRIRTARVTPKKPGAFVAVWRRNPDGETCPFESNEHIDGLLVFVRDGEQFGFFQFSSNQLANLGITSSAAQTGKRGFRVYPSWNTGLNRQATSTQRAQSSAFRMLLSGAAQ
ncbi:MepB family protein [Leucobacter salsicius]|uniref:MepB family protein n=1 Tax=Leucobacter salsicius TaxID=664638 RepID=UPI00036ACC70|nr:MepB family protein [Leucobacter salsicius]